MSRHPLPTKPLHPNVADEYINFITQDTLFPALTIEDLQSTVENDRQLRAVRAALKTNMWEAILYSRFGKYVKSLQSISLQHEKAVPCFNHTEKLFFVRHSSEYETSDSDRKVNRNL